MVVAAEVGPCSFASFIRSGDGGGHAFFDTAKGPQPCNYHSGFPCQNLSEETLSVSSGQR